MANQSQKSAPSKAASYDAANLRNAREILAHPEQHGGSEAFPAVWAKAVIERIENPASTGDICSRRNPSETKETRASACD